MVKVKKYANGGSYYVTVKDPPKPSPKTETAKPIGWNIPELNSKK